MDIGIFASLADEARTLSASLISLRGTVEEDFIWFHFYWPGVGWGGLGNRNSISSKGVFFFFFFFFRS